MKTRAIIPCCGYGVRMNMPKDKSKELLPCEEEPLIEWHIRLCKEHDLEPVFIVRPEKTDLIEYLKDHQVIQYSPEPGKEWMDTIFENRAYLGDKNILLLPDTRFEPTNTIETVKYLLPISDFVLGTHEVSDPEKWGVFSTDEKILYEKKAGARGRAWGIIGFNKEQVGLFKDLSEKRCSDLNGKVVQELFLDHFEDKTRVQT